MTENTANRRSGRTTKVTYRSYKQYDSDDDVEVMNSENCYPYNAPPSPRWTEKRAKASLRPHQRGKKERTSFDLSVLPPIGL
jgi:hypothetical protein